MQISTLTMRQISRHAHRIHQQLTNEEESQRLLAKACEDTPIIDQAVQQLLYIRNAMADDSERHQCAHAAAEHNLVLLLALRAIEQEEQQDEVKHWKLPPRTGTDRFDLN